MTLHTYRLGLSPRVRGNRHLGTRTLASIGSIPACAGEPHPPIRQRPLSPVYPRVCGGTGVQLRRKAIRDGLSPRVRGNRPLAGRPRENGGSIPACAGEPSTVHTPRLSRSVYPRVCGGTKPNAPYTGVECGLSPRVRGNPITRPESRFRIGSIPACAGEPRRLAGLRLHVKVYPRVCGGTTEPLYQVFTV